MKGSEETGRLHPDLINKSALPMPGLTVLISSYNHAPFIERTMNSVYNQTRLPEKLVIIDDGSSDNSVDIIERTLETCPIPFEFVARENRGLCASLNEGLSHVETPYLACLGSDDILLPGFVEQRVKCLETEQGAVVAYGPAYLIDKNDYVIGETTDWGPISESDPLEEMLLGRTLPAVSAVYPTSAVEKFGWNESVYLEDYELLLKLTTLGRFVWSPEILCAWRMHDTNVSHDVPALIGAVLESQNNCAELLGIRPDTLRASQSRYRIEAADHLIAAGWRREAWKLIRRDWRSAGSPLMLLRLLTRLLVPTFLFTKNRERKRNAIRKKYGKLSV